MEKISIKKEFYFEKYEFLKLCIFSDFYLSFKSNFYLKINAKRGVFTCR